MLCIKTGSLDPFFNLAAEEYALKNFEDDVFMMWQNENAVIVGYNQVTECEVDLRFAEQKNIKVVRRLSGGGAVYHDTGNVNYTFILRNSSAHFNDFKHFAAPLTEFLNSVGVPACLSGKNDITADGKKCCGTAQTMHKNDVLFHGTLLVNTDFSILSSVLKPDYSKLERHGIKSVSSRVVNISELIPITTAELMEKLWSYFAGRCENYSFNAADTAKINKIAEERYKAKEWTYG